MHLSTRILSSDSGVSMWLLFFLQLTCLLGGFSGTAMAAAGAASNSLKKGESIDLSGGSKRLISANERFQFGFFNPDGKRTCWFLCVAYFRVQPLTFVWVANPQNPISTRGGGQFRLLRNGSAALQDVKGESSFFTAGNSTVENSETTLTLMDSGNLILTNDSSQTLLWQSFDHPSDTFLPGMKMDSNMKLSSWEPNCEGSIYEAFALRLGDNEELVIKKQSSTTWKSPEAFYTKLQMPEAVHELLFNGSRVSNYSSTRIVMNSSGQIQLWDVGMTMNRMKLDWWEPKSNSCSNYGFCGRYASCRDENTRSQCRCLPGFEPNAFSFDCSALQHSCAVDAGRVDKFVKLTVAKVVKPDSQFDGARDEAGCKSECMSKCNCKAFAYETLQPSSRSDNEGGTNGGSCLIWNNDLTDLEESSSSSDRVMINVRITPINRQCETCGYNFVPYPLSTAANCGDPNYFGFSCDTSTSQLEFTIGDSKFPITRIFGENRTFHLQFPNQDNCTDTLQQLPAGSKYHISSNHCDITWDPAPEPTCNSDEDCKDWANSNCKSHTGGYGQKLCICNPNYKWNGTSLICNQDGGDQPFTPGKSSKLRMIVIITVVSGILLIGFVASLAYRRRTISRRRRRESDERLGRLYNTEKRVKDLMDTQEFNEEDKKGIDVPFFDLKTILEATNYFSDENKLGEGGFGPVYKGIFPGGQEIAVKRLSSKSVQGLEEFKNEVVLIAKLQHRNLVRLLGYCIKGDEKILLYEYMKNRSLDAFIFDRTLCLTMDWKKRFEIIMGIARGLLYLHQDSRLRIIHRDLKTSNILLDNEMNPKISDFGLARIVGGTETEANTLRIVGTYGYMSPEYALDGLFSIKSDVFSFGVIILEIISGKRNTGFYDSHKAVNLLGYAWNLWNEENIYGLIDQAISVESCNRGEVLRCVNVALLCVQEDPGDRPTMSNVVFTLGNDTATLPIPKQPAFVVKKWLRSDESSTSSKPEIISGNKLTNTMEEGR